MDEEEKNKVILPDFMIAGFSFDRRCEEWRKRNGVDEAFMEKYDTNDLESAVSTIKDVQALLSYNWGFAIEFNGCVANLCALSCQFCVDAVCNGEEYEYTTDDVDDLENAMVGPYRLKDVVDKWTITQFII